MRSDGHVSDLAESGTAEGNIESLRAELAKWQERVPKLAAALRERTEQLNTAEAELQQLRASPGNAVPTDEGTMDARLKARDELIAQLEEKQHETSRLHREAAGQLHSAQLDLKQAEEDAQSWKNKWQSVAGSLDDATAELTRERERLETERTRWRAEADEYKATHERQLQSARREAESLKVRNKNLSETTDFANQQIESLSRELSLMVERNKELEESSRQAAEELHARGASEQDFEQRLAEEEERYNKAMQAAEEELAQLTELLDKKDAALEELRSRDESAASASAEVESELADLRHQLTQAQEELAASTAANQQLQDEVVRLNSCVEDAQSSHDVNAHEKRVLDERIAALELELSDAQRQLEQRSELVRELEQAGPGDTQADDLDQDGELSRLQRELKEATHKMETFKEHADGLEDRLEAQKQLMNELEEELADARDVRAEESRRDDGKRRDLETLLNRTKDQLQAAEERGAQLLTANTKLQDDLESGGQELTRLRSELEHEREARTKQQKAVYQLQDELDTLREQVPEGDADSTTKLREVEALLRERTEELDGLRWRMEQQEQHRAPDENLVMVLNQQLEDLRAENRRLQDKTRRSSRSADLIRLKGVGAKLAEQLRNLGVSQLNQIAELDESDLEDEHHALHGFRARIVRDDWIGQAREILDQ